MGEQGGHHPPAKRKKKDAFESDTKKERQKGEALPTEGKKGGKYARKPVRKKRVDRDRMGKKSIAHVQEERKKKGGLASGERRRSPVKGRPKKTSAAAPKKKKKGRKKGGDRSQEGESHPVTRKGKPELGSAGGGR